MTCGNMNSLEDFSCHPDLRSSLFRRRGDAEVTTTRTDYVETDLNVFICGAGEGLCAHSLGRLNTD